MIEHIICDKRKVSLFVKISNIRVLELPSKHENIVTGKGLNDWSSFVIYISIAIISFFFSIIAIDFVDSPNGMYYDLKKKKRKRNTLTNQQNNRLLF